MELKELFNDIESVAINNIQKKAYSNTAKVEILNKVASRLSDITDLATEIYIGTVSDNNKEFGLYLPINIRNNRAYFKSNWYLDLKNNIENKEITISNEGLNNLHFLILKIDKHNKEQNEIFLKLSQIIDL